MRRHLTLLGLLLVISGCVGPAAAEDMPGTTPASGQTLVVFAAASLTESFTTLGQRFEAAHPGLRVVFNFGGSQQLLAQLAQGAQADVFASAGTREMDAAVSAGLVVSGTQRTMVHNRLVVIYPADNPGHLRSLADLARPGLKLDVADGSVPAGQYTLAMLDRMSQDPEYGASFRSRVLENVVSREENVKSVVSKVRLGEADAGVVYVTDIAGTGHSLGTLPVPDRFNQLATYPIAALARAPRPDLANEFVRLVLSPAGQTLLADYGFLPASGQ